MAIEEVVVNGASNLLSNENIAIVALSAMCGALLWLLILEKKDHRFTRGDLRDANSNISSIGEKAIKAVNNIENTIKEFMRFAGK